MYVYIDVCMRYTDIVIYDCKKDKKGFSIFEIFHLYQKERRIKLRWRRDYS